MKILHTNERHAGDLHDLTNFANNVLAGNFKYICVVVDGPESVNREASWASSFNDEDTHKIFAALAEQTRP